MKQFFRQMQNNAFKIYGLKKTFTWIIYDKNISRDVKMEDSALKLCHFLDNMNKSNQIKSWFCIIRHTLPKF